MTLTESDLTLQFQKRLKSFSVYLATTACLVGILVLVGWQFDIEFLKRIIPGLVAMNPVTAICFISIGASMTILNENEVSTSTMYILRAVALLTVLAGLSCMIMNVMGISGGIDHLLFTEKLVDKVTNVHNRMAPNSAFNFILTGVSLLLLSYKKEEKYKVSQYLVLISALISLLSIIGYIYGVRSFYGVLTYIPMAIHTSFCFLLISCSVLLASCDKGFMKDFTNNYVGSVLARKLIPSIIIVPVILGCIIVYGEKEGLYVTQFGTALFTAANILIFAYLIKKIQTTVNKADIARTNAEKKLLELNVQLKEKTVSLEMLNKELESFSYSISHDLKAPLRAIGGFADILQEEYGHNLDDDGKRIMSTITKNTNKMAHLIDDLLEFSRIRRKELQNSTCDMESMVKTVCSEQYALLKKNEYEIKIGELYACSGDAKMIEQVWVNLISNALKYSQKKEKPVIKIGSYKEMGHNVYFVKDNGAGFDMHYANKLFGVFQRLHSESEFQGTGIGLAIVHKIITRHGGTVWADAKNDEGASFYFSLPA
jgi:signal transduction histidine kinase